MTPIVALLGAECTGKSTLTEQLGQRLAAQRVATVSETLRDWCLAEQRTPLQHEQAGIAATQTARIHAAARQHPLVLADTTALMTALYSRHYFADDSLFAGALAEHRRHVRLTLLCCPEGIPWQQDGWLRDGDATRQRTHAELRALLDAEAIPYRLLQGDLGHRVQVASGLIEGLLLRHTSARSEAKDERDERSPAGSGARWRCSCCEPTPATTWRRPSG